MEPAFVYRYVLLPVQCHTCPRWVGHGPPSSSVTQPSTSTFTGLPPFLRRSTSTPRLRLAVLGCPSCKPDAIISAWRGGRSGKRRPASISINCRRPTTSKRQRSSSSGVSLVVRLVGITSCADRNQLGDIISGWNYIRNSQEQDWQIIV